MKFLGFLHPDRAIALRIAFIRVVGGWFTDNRRALLDTASYRF